MYEYYGSKLKEDTFNSDILPVARENSTKETTFEQGPEG